MQSKTKTRAKLIYGQAVLAADVLAASLAPTDLKPTLLGLDRLINLRKRGSLRCAKRQAESSSCEGVLERVPVEVFTMIEQKSIESAVEDARLEIMAQCECVECSGLRIEMAAADLKRGLGLRQSAELSDHVLRKIENRVMDRLKDESTPVTIVVACS